MQTMTLFTFYHLFCSCDNNTGRMKTAVFSHLAFVLTAFAVANEAASKAYDHSES